MTVSLGQLVIITCFVSVPPALAYQQFVLRQLLHTDGLMEGLLPTEHRHKQQHSS